MPPLQPERSRQEGLCAGCRVAFPFRNMTIDHIVPQSKGGTDHIDNLQLLCGACNSLKGNRDQTRFLADLKARGIVRQVLRPKTLEQMTILCRPSTSGALRLTLRTNGRPFMLSVAERSRSRAAGSRPA